ncbi:MULTISPECIES: DUF3108 domain-containing protein [unclassified Dysgonomonas]|uniref:DUF3108 domain-containing protein n=1 Tax=unclassified Dysgonomonas TaxID=2630389 RepID=UPI0013EA3113|nr:MULTISPECIES: DUF3108 domain-containing protein [unclassified Dysgonomonas]
MIKKTIKVIFTLFILFSSIQANGQCKIENKYFQAGEDLNYDLYFKYGIIYTKAGKSSLRTVSEKYNGKDAYKMSLLAESTGAAKSVFTLNDTLSSYMTKDLIPLAFTKDAHEGKEYTKENITYTYGKGGNVTIRTKRVKNGEPRFDETLSSPNCVYDMISVVFYARTLDYSKMKQGDEAAVEFMAGKKKVYMVIEHQGTEIIKGNDDKKYDCIKLVLSMSNGNKLAFEDKEEAMRVYITNDNNRMPVRLDSKLKVGSTRAILKSYSGNRHAVNTK